MHKYIVLFCFLTMSCKSLKNQVIEPFSETTKISDSFFIRHENGIDIIYSFWTKGGIMAFVIYNNSDKPIYVDWKKSSFIYQGSRFVYWEDKEMKTTKGLISNVSLSKVPIKNLFSPFNTTSIGLGSFNEATVISKEERITFIPPKSKYIKSSYTLIDKPFSMKDARIIEVPRGNKSKKTTQIKVKEFDKMSSPLMFRNFITWSFDEKFSTENYIDDEFFVKKITSMYNYYFRGKSDKNGNFEMPFSSPQKFYIEFLSK